MKCDHSGVTTKFCPNCGMPVSAGAAESLLAYLRAHEGQLKKSLDGIKATGVMPEGRVRMRESSLRKWSQWAQFVENAIAKGTTGEEA